MATDKFAGVFGDDPDVEFSDEHEDACSGPFAADADVVESAAVAEGEFAFFVDGVCQNFCVCCIGYWLVSSSGQIYNYGDAPSVMLTSTIANVPVGIMTAPDRTTYTVNGNGLRATETNQNVTQNFAYDTSNANPLGIEDGTNYYIYGPNEQPIEQINASSGTTSYLMDDSIGSTRVMTNSAGSVTATFSYDAYGNLAASSGTSTTPLLFAGQYYDTATGLYWMRARNYDPTVGQFIEQDPLQETTGQPYGYANDDPLAYSDPPGYCFFCVSTLVKVGIGAAVIGLAATGVGAVAEGAVGAGLATSLEVGTAEGVAATAGSVATASGVLSTVTGVFSAGVACARGQVATCAVGLATSAAGAGFLSAGKLLEPIADAAGAGSEAVNGINNFNQLGAVLGVGYAVIGGIDYDC